jgi:hypothetical protein
VDVRNLGRLPVTHDNNDQLDLFAVPLVEPEPSETPLTLAERFARFHQLNPAVYAVLVALTRDYVRRTGRDRVGIASVFERARWEYALRTTESPRLNNSYRSFYARLIMSQEPDLANVFEVRRSAADDIAQAAA